MINQFGFKKDQFYIPEIVSEKKLLEIKSSLESEQVIPRRYFYPALTQLPYIQNVDVVPVADDLSRRVLCLPMFHDLLETDQHRIIENITSKMQ